MRRAFYLVHLWTGLILGGLAVLAGLSGGVLVFRHEIERAQYPALMNIGAGGTLRLQDSLVAVQRAFPGAKPNHLTLPDKPGHSLDVSFKKSGLHAYVDPYRATVLGSLHQEQTPTGFLFALHTKLLSGEDGKTVVGIGGLGLLALSLSGLVVWWPRKRQKLKEHLTIRSGVGPGRKTYDAHRALGFYACGLLLLIATTGTALVFPDSAKLILSRVSGESTHEGKPKAKLKGPLLSLDELVERANQALPGGLVRRVSLPEKRSDAVVIRKRLPGESHPNGMNYLYLEPSTGEILRVDRDPDTGIAQRGFNLRYPLHIGAWGGLASKVLHSVAGLTPLVLYVTGLMIWGRKKLNARRRIRVHNPA
ncbi:PepSY domain-containing protein [bacterium]|nr:MAG: PepSY domain-containing protein [bacterium]